MLWYRTHFWIEWLLGIWFLYLSVWPVVRFDGQIFLFLYAIVFLSIMIACRPGIIATKRDVKVLCISIGQFFIVKALLCFGLIPTLWKLRIVSRWNTLVGAWAHWPIETCFAQLDWISTCWSFLEVEYFVTQEGLDIWVVTALSLGSHPDTFPSSWTVLFVLLLSGWIYRSSLGLHLRFACGHGWGWPLVRDWSRLLWVTSRWRWGNSRHWGCVGLAMEDRISSSLTLVDWSSKARGASDATTVFEGMAVRSYRKLSLTMWSLIL